MPVVLAFSIFISLTFSPTVEEAEVAHANHMDPESVSTDAELVRLAAKYGQSVQVASDIIRCESNFVADAVNHDAKVGKDIGYWQINTYYWEDKLADLGWNIHNPQDNLEAGFWILQQQGVDPWIWSAPCHGHTSQ